MKKRTKRIAKEVTGTIAQAGVIAGAIALTIGVKGGNTMASKCDIVLSDIEKWKNKD